MVILILRLKRDVRIHQGTNLIVKSDSTHAHDGMMIAVKKELRRFGQKVENWIYIVENHISVVENFASIVENFISILEKNYIDSYGEGILLFRKWGDSIPQVAKK